MNPPVAEPIQKPSAEIKKEAAVDRKAAVDAIFSGVEPEKKEEPKAEEPKPAEPVVPEPEKKEEPKLEFSEDIDIKDDLDLDSKPVSKEPEKKEESLEPEEVPTAELEKQSIRTLREQLQIQGRRAKDLAAEAQERTIEIDRLKEENRRMQEELQSPKRVASDPFSHPEIASEKQALIKSRDAFSMTLPQDARRAFAGEFENMLSSFAAISNEPSAEEQNRMIDALHEKIGSSIGDNMVPAVMQLLSSNGDRYASLIDKIKNFGDLAEEMTLKEKADSWGVQSSKVAAIVSSINSIDDEVIEADPHTPAAYVAKLVKSDPAYSARSEQVKAVITEAFHGRRPLTKAELKSLEESGKLEGVSVTDFLKAREKRVTKSRDDAMKRLYLAMMLAPELPDMIRTTSKQRQEAKAKEEEKAALLAAPSNKAEEKKAEAPARAQDTKSAVYGILNKI